jgi:uncharacterized protein (TIGR02996 family)
VRLDQGFFDDIVAHPDDDAPRLIYADWLQDNGQPHRAEFIRLQCRLATLGEHDPERLLLEEREEDLLLVHGGEWRGSLPAWLRNDPHSFQRGFVEWVNLTATKFLSKGSDLFTVAPVREVHLRAFPRKVAELATSPHLARVSTLDLGDALLTADQWQALAASPYLNDLEALTVGLDSEGVRALADWPHLPRLRRLDLQGQVVTADAFAELARVPLPALTELRLGDVTISAANLRLLSQSAPNLTDLGLWYGAVLPDAGIVLERADTFPALTSLTMVGPRIAPEAVEALGRSPLAARLESLNLNHAPHGLLALAGLARAGRPYRFRRLNLYDADVGATGADALASAVLPELCWLNLGYNQFDADALRRVLSSPHLAGLRWLKLESSPLGDQGARVLAEATHLRGLTHLLLSYCSIGDAGAQALAAAPHFSGLRHLDLGNNKKIGPEGALALAGSPSLGELRGLDLKDAPLGKKGIRALARSSHLRELRRLNLQYLVSHDDPILGEFADPAHLPRLLALGVGYNAVSPAPLERLGRAVTV